VQGRGEYAEHGPDWHVFVPAHTAGTGSLGHSAIECIVVEGAIQGQELTGPHDVRARSWGFRWRGQRQGGMDLTWSESDILRIDGAYSGRAGPRGYFRTQRDPAAQSSHFPFCASVVPVTIKTGHRYVCHYPNRRCTPTLLFSFFFFYCFLNFELAPPSRRGFGSSPPLFFDREHHRI
jgi:hypothetical protein